MNSNNKIFIIGANGYLGKSIKEYFLSKAIENKVICTSSKKNTQAIPFDLNIPNNFDYASIKRNDFIIFPAGFSSPDWIARNPEMATKINFESTVYFLSKAIDLGARVIFFSSDQVYGSQEDLFDERQTENPQSLYGELKLSVENRFNKSDNFKSIRLSNVFSKHDSFTKLIREHSNSSIPLTIYAGLKRRTIFINDVIEGIASLIDNWDSFTINKVNFGGPKLYSREMIAKLFKRFIFKNLIYEINQDDKIFFNDRPKIVNMDSYFLESKIIKRNLTSISHAILSEFQEEDFAKT